MLIARGLPTCPSNGNFLAYTSAPLNENAFWCRGPLWSWETRIQSLGFSETRLRRWREARGSWRT